MAPPDNRSGKPDPSDAATFIGAAVGAASSSAGDTSAAGAAMTMVPVSRTPTLLGTVLGGRYRILNILGQGGMGAVYKAEDVKLNRLVAIKVIRRELANDRSIMERFTQELVLSREVTHQNVVRLFDIGEADGIDFITMEFVEGEDLRSLLQRSGKLPPAEAAGIVAQICAGLQAAHAKGIIHRDLKPGNIMREASGRVVVMDFGLARTLGGDGMTQSGALIGTFEYMSPEQSRSEHIDARSDLYTVGLIFYELLTGVSPYQADSAIASLLMRSQQRAKPPTSHDASIPPGISAICERCLEIDPASRYQSAADLIADLENWKSPGGARSQVPWRVSAAARRWKAQFKQGQVPWRPVALAIVVAVAATAGAFFLARSGSSRAGPHAPMSVLVADFTNHTGDPVFDNTLEPMLNVALEGASFINAYDRSQARKLAAKLPYPSDKLDEVSSRLIAVSQGISTVITGELDHEGEGYSISLRARDPASGRILAKAEASATNKEGVLSAIPRLAAPIRKALGDATPPSVQLESVAGGFTAASLEAVHEDAIGVDEEFAGKFGDAFNSFQKASQLDPNFARAYTGMAAMALDLGRKEDAANYMKQAMAHIDRMTERERYRDRGLYYLTSGDWQKCVDEYTQLVSRYPADRVGQNNLATCYTQLRNAPKALEAAARAVEIVPKGAGQRENLSFISSFAGDFAAGERESRAALSITPEFQGYLALAEAQLGQGHAGDAAAAYEQLKAYGAIGASTASAGLADLAAYQGRYEEAARLLQQGAEADFAAKLKENGARKLASLAAVELWRGHKTESLAAAGKALAGSQAVSIRLLAGLAYADAGDSSTAEKIAGTLSSELSSEPQAYGKIIAGVAALKRGDAQAAVKNISDANALLDTWIGRFELARAYIEARAFPEADSELDRCAKRRGEAIELFMDNVPTYAWFPPVYYDQGRVREGMKSEGFADFYRSYLAIRGQAAEDPLTADIRHRIGQ
ncbi:MAG: protein kinase [Acidobacteria bacterium]|nr:protein kinase [Acidobacteriota bacterium]